MKFDDFDISGSGKFKYVIFAIVIGIVALFVVLSVILSSVVLNLSYDPKDVLEYGSIKAEDIGVGSNSGVFSEETIVEDNLSLVDVLTMDKYERYNLDLLEMSKYRVWRSLGDKNRYDLLNKEYEVRYIDNYILYRIDTKYGEVFISCSTIDGSVAKLVKNEDFTEDEIKFLEEIAEDHIIQGVNGSEKTVTIC